MAGLSDKQKEKQKILIPFDLSKKFLNNITTFVESEEPDWKYVATKQVLKGRVLTIAFTLSDESITEEVNKLDKEQRKLDEYAKPNNAEELEVIPD